MNFHYDPIRNYITEKRESIGDYIAEKGGVAVVFGLLAAIAIIEGISALSEKARYIYSRNETPDKTLRNSRKSRLEI